MNDLEGRDSVSLWSKTCLLSGRKDLGSPAWMCRCLLSRLHHPVGLREPVQGDADMPAASLAGSDKLAFVFNPASCVHQHLCNCGRLTF